MRLTACCSSPPHGPHCLSAPPTATASSFPGVRCCTGSSCPAAAASSCHLASHAALQAAQRAPLADPLERPLLRHPPPAQLRPQRGPPDHPFLRALHDARPAAAAEPARRAGCGWAGGQPQLRRTAAQGGPHSGGNRRRGHRCRPAAFLGWVGAWGACPAGASASASASSRRCDPLPLRTPPRPPQWASTAPLARCWTSAL